MSKCIDCLHYNICTFGKRDIINAFGVCPFYTDRSEWVHLPCKTEQQLWFVENGEIKASTVDRLVYEELSTDDIFTRIDGYGFSVCFKDVGKNVFLTREEAKKALEGMKGVNESDN